MREYKFRVWDKENKEMLYQGSNTTHNNSVMDCRIVLDELGFDVLVRLYGKDEYEYRNNCELMQYTGLKDKNGTEIYEGDIVKAKDPYKLNSKERFYTCEVVFTDGALFMLKHKTVKWGKEEVHYYNMRIMEIEVIGNIFENPELLEVGECKD